MPGLGRSARAYTSRSEEIPSSASSKPPMRSTLLVLASVLAIAACSAGGPTAPPSSPAAPPSAAAGVAPPPDPSPNTLHDRRAEPGVRAPAKPLVTGTARQARCGKLGKGPEDADLLAGRLRIRAPEGAKSPSAGGDGASNQEESRLVADGSKISLAIVAKETLQLDPDLYEAEPDAPTRPGHLDVEAAKFLKASFPGEEGLTIEPVEIGPSRMRAYAARPPEPNAAPGKDTALVLALLLAQDDGTLASVAFYVRGETVRNATGPDLVGCQKVAERIAASITSGPRKLERAAGRRHVADLSKEEELAVTVPPDYVAVAGAGGTRVVKLRPLSLYPGSISVSIRDGVKAPGEAEVETRAPGTLLGKPVEWRGKAGPRGGFLFAATPELGSDKRSAAVLVKATRQAKALDEMRSVAETLAIVKRP